MMNIAVQKRSSRIFLWYLDEVCSHFLSQAKKERSIGWFWRPDAKASDHKAFEVIPQITRLTMFQKEFKIYNEKAKLTLEHWKWFLDFLK